MSAQKVSQTGEMVREGSYMFIDEYIKTCVSACMYACMNGHISANIQTSKLEVRSKK